jgi:2-phosphoglycerate kinase
MKPTPRVILIGGAPLTGKSTVARMLAAKLEYACISTDDIAAALRAATSPQSHPALHFMAGEDYREYYISRSPEQLIAEAEQYHAALWPALAQVIKNHLTWAGPAVIEGWALRPEDIAGYKELASCWLIAPRELLESRLRAEVDFYRGASDEEKMIRHFLARSMRYNEIIRAAAARLHLPSIAIESDVPPEAICLHCLEALNHENLPAS